MLSVSVVGSCRKLRSSHAALFLRLSSRSCWQRRAPKLQPKLRQQLPAAAPGPACRKTCRGANGSPAPSAAPAAAPAAERAAQPDNNMRIVYLGKEYPEPLPLSYAEKPITDKGIQGARLMLKEANQAGNFVGHGFELIEAIIPEDGDIVAKAKEVLAAGESFIIADLEPNDLLAVADLPEAKNAVIMNIRSSATVLRQEECRVNVFHVIPDYAMRADALGQYLVWKKWPRWFVMRRDTPEDQDYLAQIQRAASALVPRLSRTGSIGCRQARGTSTQATSRCRRRSRWRRKARPSTTSSGLSTATTISAII